VRGNGEQVRQRGRRRSFVWVTECVLGWGGELRVPTQSRGKKKSLPLVLQVWDLASEVVLGLSADRIRLTQVINPPGPSSGFQGRLGEWGGSWVVRGREVG